MAFPQSFLDELVARNDIVEVVSEYVQLTKKSGNNQFGLCPFHSEKTPSFSVAYDKQIYHCFGCGKGGGVINFIMDVENLPFQDAVAFLAKRAGMQMPEDDTPAELRGRRTRILELNKEAARFFYENLKKPYGAPAVEYIKKRGISPEFVKKFGLGAAPDGWSYLTDAMTAKGYTGQELIDAGLAKRGKNGGLYDVFRNRLVFPVIDVRGSVIGFSGRILGDGEPKYLNSPDTPVFQKSRNLFALNLAKRTKRGMLILVEGNIDVVSLHQAGFDCAVASLGTSLTPEQARLMSRYTDSVVIAYDSDGAGSKAAQRAIGLLEKTGMKVRVLRMDGAKDPDEYIKSKGADAFSILLDKSENHIEYRLLAAKAKYDMDTNDGRFGFLREATSILASLPNALERDIYGVQAAEYAGVSADAVAVEVKKAVRKRAAEQKKRQERDNMRPDNVVQPKEKSIRYDNVMSASAEEGIIRLLMLDASLADKAAISEEEFSSPLLGKVYSIIKARCKDGESVSPAILLAQLDTDEASHITNVLQRPESSANAQKALEDYIERIKTERIKKNAGGNMLAVREKLRQKKGLEDKNGKQ